MSAAGKFTAGRENGRRRPKGYADWRPQARTRRLLEAVDAVLVDYEAHLLPEPDVLDAQVERERDDRTELLLMLPRGGT